MRQRRDRPPRIPPYITTWFMDNPIRKLTTYSTYFLPVSLPMYHKFYDPVYLSLLFPLCHKKKKSTKRGFFSSSDNSITLIAIKSSANATTGFQSCLLTCCNADFSLAAAYTIRQTNDGGINNSKKRSAPDLHIRLKAK